MIQKLLIAIALLVLAAWLWFCQNQINVLATQLKQSSKDNLRAAELQLEAVKLAESNRQRAAQEEDAKAKAKAEEKVKFTSALRKASEDYRKAWNEASPGPKHTLPIPHSFIPLLQKISTAECPTAFRVAWQEFLYQERKENNLIHNVTEVTSALHGDLSSLEQNGVNDAFHRCQLIALEYGVAL